MVLQILDSHLKIGDSEQGKWIGDLDMPDILMEINMCVSYFCGAQKRMVEYQMMCPCPDGVSSVLTEICP